MEKIPVTIGILTFNSGKTLARALESVKDFAEIIIADGGSTDSTLEIARRYGAKIINQSNPGHPITDFSLERNRLLNAATQGWFFYLDSDEVASSELVNDISRAVSNTNGAKVYQIRYQLTSPDLLTKYRTAISYYQPRFFSTKIGAQFIKKVHEKITWDKEKYPAGKIEGPWYVPLDIQMDFSVYKKKIHHRLGIMIAEWESKNPLLYLKKGIIDPLITIGKHILKIFYTRIRYSWRELVPLRYEFYRIYSQLYIIARMTKQYVRNISL